MAEWRAIILEAEQAKKDMIVKPKAGERKFKRLLGQHGADGMIYFKRAEAWQALGETDKALGDYGKAEALFPMDAWKARAREGIRHCEKS